MEREGESNFKQKFLQTKTTVFQPPILDADPPTTRKGPRRVRKRPVSSSSDSDRNKPPIKIGALDEESPPSSDSDSDQRSTAGGKPSDGSSGSDDELDVTGATDDKERTLEEQQIEEDNETEQTGGQNKAESDANAKAESTETTKQIAPTVQKAEVSQPTVHTFRIRLTERLQKMVESKCSKQMSFKNDYTLEEKLYVVCDMVMRDQYHRLKLWITVRESFIELTAGIRAKSTEFLERVQADGAKFRYRKNEQNEIIGMLAEIGKLVEDFPAFDHGARCRLANASAGAFDRYRKEPSNENLMATIELRHLKECEEVYLAAISEEIKLATYYCAKVSETTIILQKGRPSSTEDIDRIDKELKEMTAKFELNQNKMTQLNEKLARTQEWVETQKRASISSVEALEAWEKDGDRVPYDPEQDLLIAALLDDPLGLYSDKRPFLDTYDFPNYQGAPKKGMSGASSLWHALSLRATIFAANKNWEYLVRNAKPDIVNGVINSMWTSLWNDAETANRWNEIKIAALKEIVEQKHAQYPELHMYLAVMGGRRIKVVDVDPQIGSGTCPLRFESYACSKTQGENKLGNIYMEMAAEHAPKLGIPLVRSNKKKEIAEGRRLIKDVWAPPPLVGPTRYDQIAFRVRSSYVLYETLDTQVIKTKVEAGLEQEDLNNSDPSNDSDVVIVDPNAVGPKPFALKLPQGAPSPRKGPSNQASPSRKIPSNNASPARGADAGRKGTPPMSAGCSTNSLLTQLYNQYTLPEENWPEETQAKKNTPTQATKSNRFQVKRPSRLLDLALETKILEQKFPKTANGKYQDQYERSELMTYIPEHQSDRSLDEPPVFDLPWRDMQSQQQDANFRKLATLLIPLTNPEFMALPDSLSHIMTDKDMPKMYSKDLAGMESFNLTIVGDSAIIWSESLIYSIASKSTAAGWPGIDAIFTIGQGARDAEWPELIHIVPAFVEPTDTVVIIRCINDYNNLCCMDRLRATNQYTLEEVDRAIKRIAAIYVKMVGLVKEKNPTAPIIVCVAHPITSFKARDKVLTSQWIKHNFITQDDVGERVATVLYGEFEAIKRRRPKAPSSDFWAVNLTESWCNRVRNTWKGGKDGKEELIMNNQLREECDGWEITRKGAYHEWIELLRATYWVLWLRAKKANN